MFHSHILEAFYQYDLFMFDPLTQKQPQPIQQVDTQEDFKIQVSFAPQQLEAYVFSLVQ